MTRDVWYVTGCSSGFGLSTVQELLKQGYKVAATTRSIPRLLGKLTGLATDNLLPLEVDLTSEASIRASVAQTISKFGQLDVVVNNAGSGQMGAIEEVSREEILRQFEINVLAVHTIIQAVLPHFRSRSNGYFINIASALAVTPVAGMGIYTASKTALLGLTDVLVNEVAQFGIKATSVIPGPFKTGFGDGSVRAAKRIDVYAELYERHNGYKSFNHPGSTELSAKLFIDLAKNPNPPARIFLGKNANDRGIASAEEHLKEIEQWKAAGTAVDLPQ
jgi:NAD(P)-dependent dehydrogenase (short-subunit alcohol dehydrogenase family)